MSDHEEEDKRAKQLEEARKRVEELKKKKNKKKNKKKTKKDATTTDISEPTDSELNSEKEGTLDVETEISEEPKAEKETEENSKGEDKEEEYTNEMSAEPKELITEDTVLDEENNEKTIAEENITEESVKETEVPLNDTVKTVEENVIEPLQSDEIKENSRENSVHQTLKEVDELFGNDTEQTSDFLTTIEKAKEENEISELKEQLEAMQAENKKLKFANMDHETTIEELESEIKSFKEQLAKSVADLNVSRTECELYKNKLQDAENRLSQRDTQSKVQFASFNSPSPVLSAQSGSSFNGLASNMPQPSIDRVVLNKWHGWNPDMTTWRSIGSGPIVEF